MKSIAVAVPIALASLAVTYEPAIAQESGEEASSGPIEEVVVVGSRRRDRSASDSPVPVDVIGGDDFLAHGNTDMDELVAALVPSYNVAQEPISDAATFIRPATLRSLPPDATLVLVNGKRRHRAAVIALLGAGISGGSQGPDLSAIPAIALDRLEVLRDGASAQYGSDAIAGIMNFVLREDAEGTTVDAKWGQYFEGDGSGLTIAANVGLPLTDLGFANLSFEWKESDPTSRSAQRGDAQGLIDAGNSHVRRPAAQIWGAPEISGDFKLFGNFGLDLANGSEAYAFGNWAERQVEGGFYFRNPHTRGGVFRGPVVDGTPTVKVADLTPDGSGNCPVVHIVNNVPDAAALSAIASDPNCYSLIERFPGGFTPQFGGYVHDLSIAGGLRGTLDSGWFYDLSATAGRSNAQFYIYNTINPQLLWQRNEIDTYYDAGAYTETDRVLNFDLSKPIDSASFGSVNVAVGVEYRDETFRIDNGEPNSFYIDPNLQHGLASQGFGVGSNGFPGFQPGDAGENTVRSFAAYLDLESNVSENLLLGGALRYENYAEYGNTLDGKIAARLQVGYNMAIRGAVSTGFRVPTAGQANLRNVTTEFNMGFLSDIATLPPTNPIAQQKGAQALTPEESVNTTLGVVFDVGGVDVTMDYYRIEIEDRISFTSRFNLTSRGHHRPPGGRGERRAELHVGAVLLEPANRGGVGYRRGRHLAVLPRRRAFQPDIRRQLAERGIDEVQSRLHQRQPAVADRRGPSRLPVHPDLDPQPGPVAHHGAGPVLRRVLRRADQRRFGGLPPGTESAVRRRDLARCDGLGVLAVRPQEHLRRIPVDQPPRRGRRSRLPGTVAVRLQRRLLLRPGAVAHRVATTTARSTRRPVTLVPGVVTIGCGKPVRGNYVRSG